MFQFHSPDGDTGMVITACPSVIHHGTLAQLCDTGQRSLNDILLRCFQSMSMLSLCATMHNFSKSFWLKTSHLQLKY